MIIDATLAKLGCTANASAMRASMCGWDQLAYLHMIVCLSLRGIGHKSEPQDGIRSLFCSNMESLKDCSNNDYVNLSGVAIVCCLRSEQSR